MIVRIKGSGPFADSTLSGEIRSIYFSEDEERKIAIVGLVDSFLPERYKEYFPGGVLTFFESGKLTHQRWSETNLLQIDLRDLFEFQQMFKDPCGKT